MPTVAAAANRIQPPVLSEPAEAIKHAAKIPNGKVIKVTDIGDIQVTFSAKPKTLRSHTARNFSSAMYPSGCG